MAHGAVRQQQVGSHLLGAQQPRALQQRQQLLAMLPTDGRQLLLQRLQLGLVAGACSRRRACCARTCLVPFITARYAAIGAAAAGSCPIDCRCCSIRRPAAAGTLLLTLRHHRAQQVGAVVQYGGKGAGQRARTHAHRAAAVGGGRLHHARRLDRGSLGRLGGAGHRLTERHQRRRHLASQCVQMCVSVLCVVCVCGWAVVHACACVRKRVVVERGERRMFQMAAQPMQLTQGGTCSSFLLTATCTPTHQQLHACKALAQVLDARLQVHLTRRTQQVLARLTQAHLGRRAGGRGTGGKGLG